MTVYNFGIYCIIIYVWMWSGGRVPRTDPADRVVPVGHGRGRGHALLRAAVPQADPAPRARRHRHHGRLDAPVRHLAPAIQVHTLLPAVSLLLAIEFIYYLCHNSSFLIIFKVLIKRIIFQQRLCGDREDKLRSTEDSARHPDGPNSGALAARHQQRLQDQRGHSQGVQQNDEQGLPLAGAAGPLTAPLALTTCYITLVHDNMTPVGWRHYRVMYGVQKKFE